MTTPALIPPSFDELIRKEADSWGNHTPDPDRPQIWQDERLFEIFFGEEYRRLVQRAIAAGPEVLELGCGEGGLALTLARAGCKVTGLDLSEERIHRARSNAAAAGLAGATEFTVADLNRATLPARRYSCVVAHDALHHILELDHLVSQVKNTLKRGGTILVMDHCGMGRLRRVMAAGLTAVLPTFTPYAAKWRSRKHLRSFLAGEEEKREAIRSGHTSVLHPASPFEGISQHMLLGAMQKAFRTVRVVTYLPFWYFLAPKVRVPGRLRPGLGKLFRKLDNGLSVLGVTGAYFSFEGRDS